MTCTGADGQSCTDYGIVVPCGPEPIKNPELPEVVYNGPLIVSPDGVSVTWRGEEAARIPGDTIQFLVMAKAYHRLFQLQEEEDVPIGDSGTADIPFPVEDAVVYKVSVRRVREGQAGPWNSQELFYGGTEWTYLIDEAGRYIVEDDDDAVYFVAEDVPDSTTWAYNPDGTIMLGPDGIPVQKP